MHPPYTHTHTQTHTHTHTPCRAQANGMRVLTCFPACWLACQPQRVCFSPSHSVAHTYTKKKNNTENAYTPFLQIPRKHKKGTGLIRRHSEQQCAMLITFTRETNRRDNRQTCVPKHTLGADSTHTIHRK